MIFQFLITRFKMLLSKVSVEHALFIAVVFKSCGRGDSFMDSMDRYFQFRFDYVFTLITYNAVWGVFFQVLPQFYFFIKLNTIFKILNLFSTISWNFMDLFIILMSLCLFSRFKQVSQNIHFLTAKHVRTRISLSVIFFTLIEGSR